MSRLPVLALAPQLPWPLDDGGRIGLWQTTASLAREFDVTLLALAPPAEVDRPAPRALLDLGVRVTTVPHAPPSVAAAALRGLVGRWPYTLVRYRSAAFDAAVADAVGRFRPAFAFVNHLHLAPCVDALGDCPMVLRQHNVEHRWLERYARSEPRPWVSAYARLQAARMRGAEGRLCERAALVLAIHDDEARALRAIAPRARVEVVPVGVDFARFARRAPASPPVVLLAASFAWPPNAEGARRFLTQGWPRLRARVPAARLRLVGKGLPESLAGAARDAGAEPVGFVESMAEEFAAAAALVVPLWAGAGARVKIVEALAAEVPVVSTPMGAEGLGLEHGRHVLLAEEPGALGDALAGLLADGARAAALARAGHEVARANWSLDTVARLTCDLCWSVVRKPGPNGGARP